MVAGVFCTDTSINESKQIPHERRSHLCVDVCLCMCMHMPIYDKPFLGAGAWASAKGCISSSPAAAGARILCPQSHADLYSQCIQL